RRSRPDWASPNPPGRWFELPLGRGPPGRPKTVPLWLALRRRPTWRLLPVPLALLWRRSEARTSRRPRRTARSWSRWPPPTATPSSTSRERGRRLKYLDRADRTEAVRGDPNDSAFQQASAG